RRAVRKIPNSQLIEKAGKCAQFEHYKQLVKQLDDEKKLPDKTWILFTDDDDPWHESRAAIYHCRIANLQKDGHDKTTQAIRVSRGKATLDRTGNYWLYTATANLVRTFLNKLPDTMAKHNFCDV